jgi:hypothetical protein
VSPDGLYGAGIGALGLAFVAFKVAESVRDDYTETRSIRQALVHPGALALAALLSLVGASAWDGS